MHASVLSAALIGVDAFTVEVEIDIGGGVPNKSKLVGLPEGAVRESLDRVRSALRNSGFEIPNRKLTVNFAPADIRKAGSAFDLPLALAILAAQGTLGASERLRTHLIVGELSLDGRVKSIKGGLPTALLARAKKFAGVVLPRENAPAAAVAGGEVAILGVETLREAFEFFDGVRTIEPAIANPQEMTKQLPGYETIPEQLFEYRSVEIYERNLEDVLENDLNQLELGLQLVGRQYSTLVGPIDLLARDPAGNYVVIELKRGRSSDQVVGQISRYMSWVQSHLARESKVRGIIVSNSVDNHLQVALSGLKYDVKVLVFDMRLAIKEIKNV
ncbi:MAG: endonuclease NucS domain-containing protein [Candidatus Binataceae bacterium]